MKPISKFFLVSLILTMTGCVKPAATPTGQSAPLLWATALSPLKQDWTECASRSCATHTSLVMEGLVRADRSETLALAEKLSFVSPKEIRIQLKRGILWSDGAELKAKDFLFSWKSTWAKCSKIPAAKYFSPISGTEAGCQKTPLSGVEALSDYDLRITLSTPSPFFTRRLAHPVFFPKRSEAPESTLGRFIFVEKGKYAPNLKHYLVKKPSRGIQFLEVANESERVSLFLEGSIDVADGLGPLTIFSLRGNPSLQTYLTGQKVYLLLDAVPALKLRQTLIESLSFSEPIELLALGLEENHALISETDQAVIPHRQESPGATQEKFAGLTFPLSVPPDPLLEQLAENFQAQWHRRFGFASKLEHSKSKKTLRLRKWAPDWFEPSPPPFAVPNGQIFNDREAALAFWNKVQKDLVEKEFLVAPLFETKGYVLRKSGLGAMEKLQTGEWAFDRFSP